MSSNGITSKYSSAHANPQGPGDSRPTTSQILQDEGLLNFPNRLSDKTVLITGTSGLGLEVAKALHQTGANVFISGRCDDTKGREIAASISTSSDNKSTHPVQFIHMDLSDLSSIKTGAENFLSEAKNIVHLLICNAGLMAPPDRMTTKQGHEMQFGVNHLAHFLLFEKLRDSLVASSTKEFASRVVVVSSSAHRISGIPENADYDFEKAEYNPYLGYGQSKTANVYMANEIERQYGRKGLHGLSVHPGVIMETGLNRHAPPGDPAEFEKMIKENPTLIPRSKSTAQGAGTILWTAVASSLEGKGGIFTEDCDVGRPADPAEKGAKWWEAGTSEWCYDQAAEGKLWSDSKEMVKAWL